MASPTALALAHSGSNNARNMPNLILDGFHLCRRDFITFGQTSLEWQWRGSRRFATGKGRSAQACLDASFLLAIILFRATCGAVTFTYKGLVVALCTTPLCVAAIVSLLQSWPHRSGPPQSKS